MTEIGSVLCKDAWSKIIEFCSTHSWLKLSYTCRGINEFKFNRLLMFNKRRCLKHTLSKKEIVHWFQVGRGTLFNVYLTENPSVTDEHFQFLEGIHTLDMSGCENITDRAFCHIKGIHTLDMSGCAQVTDSAFPYLTGIHTLYMADCWRITDNSAPHLTGIHTLCLIGCENITDKAFSHLAGVHTLYMSGCQQITDEAFPHLTGIHTLYMSWCKNITDEAFRYLTGIHRLEMNGCDQESITERGLLNLKGIHTLGWSESGRDKTFIEKVVGYCESNSITLLGMKNYNHT